MSCWVFLKIKGERKDKSGNCADGRVLVSLCKKLLITADSIICSPLSSHSITAFKCGGADFLGIQKGYFSTFYFSRHSVALLVLRVETGERESGAGQQMIREGTNGEAGSLFDKMNRWRIGEVKRKGRDWKNWERRRDTSNPVLITRFKSLLKRNWFGEERERG